MERSKRNLCEAISDAENMAWPQFVPISIRDERFRCIAGATLKFKRVKNLIIYMVMLFFDRQTEERALRVVSFIVLFDDRLLVEEHE